jgi:hypothetical protein
MGVGNSQWPLPEQSTEYVVNIHECLYPIPTTTLSSVPLQIGLTESPKNPGIPKDKTLNLPTLPERFRSPSLRIGGIESTAGAGPTRVYLDIQVQPPDVAYPPRPVAGSIADLDIVMDNCDFGRSKVRRFGISDLSALKTYISMYGTVWKCCVLELAWTMASEFVWTTMKVGSTSSVS